MNTPVAVLLGSKSDLKYWEDSKKYLKERGLLQVVARHNKGGKTLEKKMKGVFIVDIRKRYMQQQ